MPFLRLVSDEASTPPLIWLDPLPQHFDTPTGSGLFHERVVGAKACAAISNLSAAAWRGTLFEAWASEAIVRLNNRTSHRRPFAYLRHAFETFAARHDLHAMGANDCTHFCYSPMLYAPVWRMLLGHLRPPGHVGVPEY